MIFTGCGGMSKRMDMDRLKDVLSDPIKQKGLIKLYADDQAECRKNGKCGMEIGMAREKDLVAYLLLHLGPDIDYDITNNVPEDFMYRRTEKVSVKHMASKLGTPVKAKWTSADVPAQDSIKHMIEAPDNYYPALLICYIDIEKKSIVYIFISAEQNKNTIKTLGNAAFKIPSGNTRGIEYSREAMTELMKNICFRVDIANADLTTGMDPIQRRMNILRSMMPESVPPSAQ